MTLKHLVAGKKSDHEEFVYVHEIDPSILTSLRYAGADNFSGKPIDGYLKPKAILTKKAALALQKAQELACKDGFSVLIYDAYRPQQAVNHFIRWS